MIIHDQIHEARISIFKCGSESHVLNHFLKAKRANTVHETIQTLFCDHHDMTKSISWLWNCVVTTPEIQPSDETGNRLLMATKPGREMLVFLTTLQTPGE